MTSRSFGDYWNITGTTVSEAGSREEALEALTNCIDLMIIDLNVPGLERPEVCEAIKSVPTPKLIVVATGAINPKMIELARVLGATTTLEKALTEIVLVPVVRWLLTPQAESTHN